MKTFDSIVLGLGGMGSAAAYHLARRGQKVLGLEQFGMAHDRGSSHGDTRVFRRAYFEHPDYVPLLNRAYELWLELEDAVRKPLLTQCGVVIAGQPDCPIIAGVKRATTLHRLAVVELPPADIEENFSEFLFDAGMEILFENYAGYLKVEDCIRTHWRLAKKHGAHLHADETVIAWKSDGTSVTVTTDKEAYRARSLVICGGAWTGRVLAELRLPLEVRRAVSFWFSPPPDAPGFDLEQGGTVFGIDTPFGFFYGVPAVVYNLRGPSRTWVKVAAFAPSEPVANPSQLDRELHPQDAPPVLQFLRRYLPNFDTEVRHHSVCMYTMTPDQHFIIDRHRDYSNVAYAAGFSGHGFKFASVIGSILADLTIDGKTGFEIGFLSAARAAISGRS